MFRGSFLGQKKMEKRLSEVSDRYSSSDEDDDSEHDIASALTEAQLQKDSKPPSFRDLIACPRDGDEDDDEDDCFFDKPSYAATQENEEDLFSTQDVEAADYDSNTEDMFQVKVRGHAFGEDEFRVVSNQDEVFGSNIGDMDDASFSSNARDSPRRVMSMQPFAVSSFKSAKVTSLKAEEDFEEKGHDSFDFSVVQFSPQHKKKEKVGGGLSKHFAAMTQPEIVTEEDEEEEEVSIAEFSGQWRTMQHPTTPASLLTPPATPKVSGGNGVLRRSSYETPRARDPASHTVMARSRSFEERPMKPGSRSVPSTPVVASSDSPTKQRAHTTGTTRKKRSIKLKASALGLQDGATATEIKAALERVSPNQLKAALEKLIESDDDEDDDPKHRGRRRPSGSSKSVKSHKERSRSKGTRSKAPVGVEVCASPDDRHDEHHSRRSRSSHKSDGTKEKSRSHSSKSTKSAVSCRSSDKLELRSFSKTLKKPQKQQQPVQENGFSSPVSPTWSSSSNSSSTAACTSSDSSFNAAAPLQRQRRLLKDSHQRPQKQFATADPFHGAFDD